MDITHLLASVGVSGGSNGEVLQDRGPTVWLVGSPSEWGRAES